jgi:hypothetical protein
MGSVSHEQETAAAAPQGASPMGRYGPQVSITRFDSAPRELEWQLPLDGELYRLIPGPDRPDYSLLVLERPLHFYPAPGFDLGRVEPEQRVEDRKGRPMVRVHALLVCARFVGQQLQPGMRDLAINIAYVIDNSLARDAVVDFSKIEVAAVGFLDEGHARRGDAGAAGVVGVASEVTAAPAVPVADEHADAGEQGGDDAAADAGGAAGPALAGGEAGPRPESGRGVDAVIADAARALRDGVAAHRARPVGRLSATLVVGPDHRLVGLSGNADGEAPVPTPGTFEQLNAILAGLGGLDAPEPGAGLDPREPDGDGSAERRFTVRVEGDSVAVEKISAASA